MNGKKKLKRRLKMAQGKAHRLEFCPNCKEKSAIVRHYARKNDNVMERLFLCINKGCGYKLVLPFRTLTESEVNNV
jgi:DNA-directed RNA polymerase subunit M/transcription elongation factor TFIIS